MDDNGESQALLMKDYVSENPYRGGGGSSTGEESCSHSNDWWAATGSSCSTSYSSESRSNSDSEVEWESSITTGGELFYVESNPVPIESDVINQSEIQEASTSNNQSSAHRHRHTTKGKLARLIRRQNSKQQPNRIVHILADSQPVPGATNLRCPSSNKVTFQDWQEGEVREVSLSVDPRSGHNLGRRATLCETLLGLVVSTFSDKTRIMVAGFIPNGEALKYRSIKIGDWLRCVDGQEVSLETIDLVLARITSPCKVSLKLQRVAGCDVTAQSQLKCKQQSDLVKQLLGQTPKDDLSSVLRDLPVGVLYLTLEGLTEGDSEHQGVIYCYPPPATCNALCSVRGVFTTLYDLLSDLTPTAPVRSMVLLRDQLTHVAYTAQGKELMLLAVPDNRCSSREAVLLSAELARTLQFSHQTLSRAFSMPGNEAALNQFFSLFFARLLSSGLWPNARQSILQEDISARVEQHGPAQFEDLLPAAHWVPLPKQVQVQLDEALSELEANDFGDMGDAHNGYQRMYTIIGSCFYHKGYLLASHLTCSDLVDIHGFCRQQGLLHLCRSEPVKSLVVWREVFPASCNHGLAHQGKMLTTCYQLPRSRWFMLIAGKGQEMLVMLLEAGSSAVKVEGFPGPDVFYVEQAQDTLAHIQKSGVPTIASKWLAANLKPQVKTPEDVSQTKVLPRLTENLLGLVRPLDATPTKQGPLSGSNTAMTGSSVNRRTPEVTSILKRRGSTDRSTGLPTSGFSLQGSTSEDSTSLAASLMSEVSDEAAPILGRRAERERGRLSDSEHSDSDSDWELYRNQNRQRSSTFELYDASLTLLANIGGILPTKLSAGEHNLLFHYVNLDLTEGVLLCPPVNHETTLSEQLREILDNFRRGCQDIHTLLSNTVRFKKLVGQEISNSLINKSLVAIKEHGILFECASTEPKKSAGLETYWVVGRLFFTPYPREVYVCYHDSAPQNMVEVAFRLGLSASG